MELSFSELRAKEVVNTQDGRKLGKVCDLVFCYPENRWLGIVAPNGRSFGFKRNGVFIDLKNIVKIGEDVVLVSIGSQKKPSGKPPIDEHCPPTGRPPFAGGDFANHRSFGEYE